MSYYKRISPYSKQVPTRVTVVVLLLFMAVVVAACTPAIEEPTIEEPTPTSTGGEEATGVNPGQLTVAVGDLGNERFDIFYVPSTAPSQNYSQLIHGFLTHVNEAGDIAPGIASDWSISEDALTWTFTIRPGVKFHDGSELTAEDVLWSFQHYFSPEAAELTIQPNVAQLASLTDRIELTGPDQVSWTSTEPVPAFPFTISNRSTAWFPILPTRSELYDEDEALAYDKDPVGAGPLKLVRHIAGSTMEFERFDDYYYQPEYGLPEDQRVNFRTFVMVLLPEEASRVAAVESGDADLAPVTLSSREQLQAAGLHLVSAPEASAVDVRLYGCADPQYPCHDKRVRLALDYAIDKEVVQDLYGGADVFEIKGFAAITPSTFGYTPATDPLPFDPDMARQLLTEAGYPGGEGFGTLVVRTFEASAMPLQIETAQLFADMWRTELGLNVEVQVGDVNAVEEASRAGQADGQVVLGDTGTRFDATGTMSRKYGILDDENALHGDAELARRVQEAYATFDPTEREEALQELWVAIGGEDYQIGVGYLNALWAAGPRVQAWQPYGLTAYASALHTLILDR